MNVCTFELLSLSGSTSKVLLWRVFFSLIPVSKLAGSLIERLRGESSFSLQADWETPRGGGRWAQWRCPGWWLITTLSIYNTANCPVYYYSIMQVSSNRKFDGLKFRLFLFEENFKRSHPCYLPPLCDHTPVMWTLTLTLTLTLRQSYNGQSRFLGTCRYHRVLRWKVLSQTISDHTITGHKHAAFLQRKYDFDRNTGKGHVKGHAVKVDGQSNFDASICTQWRVGLPQ